MIISRSNGQNVLLALHIPQDFLHECLQSIIKRIYFVSIFYLHLLIADIEHKVGRDFYDLYGVSKVNIVSPGFNKSFGLRDPSFVETNLSLNTIKLVFQPNEFNIGGREMMATLDEQTEAHYVTDFTIIVNGHHVFHTSRSHISRKMPLNFTSIDVTEERPTLSIMLRAFDGPHPGFNITVLIVGTPLCKVKL